MYFLPFFLSWIILGSILLEMFAYGGIVNTMLENCSTRIMFFLDNGWFRTLVIFIGRMESMGYNMVIFLAAIMGVDETLYEADRNRRRRQIPTDY